MCRWNLLAPLLLLVSTPPSSKAADGDPDPGFSGDGRAEVFMYEMSNSALTSSAVLADGAVVVAGCSDLGAEGRDMLLARFDVDGERDLGFGIGGGFAWLPVDLIAAGADCAHGVHELVNGGLQVVGTAAIASAPWERPVVVRLNASGQLDPGFGSGGVSVIATHPFGAAASFDFSLAARGPDGSVVLAGLCSNCGQGGLPDLLALRLRPDGQLDTVFANQGYFSFGRAADGGNWLIERATAVAVDRHGRLLLAGHQETFDDPAERQSPLLVRLTVNGALDASFGEGGVVLLEPQGSWTFSALATDGHDDSIVAAVVTAAGSAGVPATQLLRVRSNGSLDNGFNGTGALDLTREEGSAIHALVIDAARRITAGGWIDRNGFADHRDFYIARALSDGRLDPAFDGNGLVRVAMDVPDCDVCSEAVASMGLWNGQPVLAGAMQAYIAPNDVDYYSVLRLQSAPILIFADGFEP